MTLGPRAGAQAPPDQPSARDFFEDTVGRSMLTLVVQALPEDVTVAFHLTGAGGGAWQVARTPEGPRMGPVEPGPKDCTVRCTARVFMGIVTGGLDARQAFLEGRLQLRGDIGLALRLQGILPDAA